MVSRWEVPVCSYQKTCSASYSACALVHLCKACHNLSFQDHPVANDTGIAVMMIRSAVSKYDAITGNVWAAETLLLSGLDVQILIAVQSVARSVDSTTLKPNSIIYGVQVQVSVCAVSIHSCEFVAVQYRGS